ncbi:MAG TPA: A24 family peptidase [Bacillales bacterium]
MNLVLFFLLTSLVTITGYTDWTSRKVYNKILLPCLVIGLILHIVDGSFWTAVTLMTMAFVFFYLVYMMGMTSPGDVKLFAVMALIVADSRVISGGLAVYMIIQFALALIAVWKTCRLQQISWLEVFKRDAFGFVTKMGPVIQPVRFPGAVVMGGGVWICDLFLIWVS